MKKSLIVILIVLALILNTIPITVLAASDEEVISDVKDMESVSSLLSLNEEALVNDTVLTEEINLLEEEQTKTETQTDAHTNEGIKAQNAFPELDYAETVEGVTIHIYAPDGALPEGTYVTVRPVVMADVEEIIKKTQEENPTVLNAVDISFYDADGNEIEPLKAVSVTFESDAFGQDKGLDIIHIRDNGTTEKMAIDIRDGAASFTSNDFSVYTTVATQTRSAEDKLTLHVTGILNTAVNKVNGHAVAYDIEQTMTVQSKIFSAAGVLSWAGGRNKKANGVGYEYTFLNVYVISDESNDVVLAEQASDVKSIKKLQYKGNGETVITYSDDSTETVSGSTDLYISPVYSAKASWYLFYHYIDRISTGSGSWKNIDGVTQYSHTFVNPEEKSPELTRNRYRFLFWKNDETGEIFHAGDTNIYQDSSMREGETKTVNIYAYWQPSVKVNYVVEGTPVKTEISFYNKSTNEDERIGTPVKPYDFIPELDGCQFIGWFESGEDDAERIEDERVFYAPAVTKEPVEQTVINLYAKFDTTYRVEHYLEQPDGTFVLDEQATDVIEHAVVGTEVTAREKSFKGFTVDESNEETVKTGIVKKGLVLKLYYTRDSYEVTYQYTGKLIPEEAVGQLPEKASYQYGQTVPAGKVPVVAGYVFDGWNGEVKTMPAENVIVSGSWSYAPDTLFYDANGGTGRMPSSEGLTFNPIAVKENAFNREGYTFTGWNTMKDGSGTAYSAGDLYRLTLNEDILYAQWEKTTVMESYARLPKTGRNSESKTLWTGGVLMGAGLVLSIVLSKRISNR